MKYLLDTNILIDLTLGKTQALALLESLLDDAAISTISWMETMAGARTGIQKEKIRAFLESFPLVETNREIAEIAVSLRQQYRLRLPDAIIWATAKHQNACLLTRDSGDFPSDALDIRFPYPS